MLKRAKVFHAVLLQVLSPEFQAPAITNVFTIDPLSAASSASIFRVAAAKLRTAEQRGAKGPAEGEYLIQRR
jgi:hypothetical protein